MGKLENLLLPFFFYTSTTEKGGIHFGELLYPIKYLMDEKKNKSNHSTTRLEWFTHANDRSKTDENLASAFAPRRIFFRLHEFSRRAWRKRINATRAAMCF